MEFLGSKGLAAFFTGRRPWVLLGKVSLGLIGREDLAFNRPCALFVHHWSVELHEEGV